MSVSVVLGPLTIKLYGRLESSQRKGEKNKKNKIDDQTQAFFKNILLLQSCPGQSSTVKA